MIAAASHWAARCASGRCLRLSLHGAKGIGGTGLALRRKKHDLLPKPSEPPKPMLAKNARDLARDMKDSESLRTWRGFVQPKLDGWRIIADHPNAQNSRVWMKRGVSVYSFSSLLTFSSV